MFVTSRPYFQHNKLLNFLLASRYKAKISEITKIKVLKSSGFKAII